MHRTRAWARLLDLHGAVVEDVHIGNDVDPGSNPMDTGRVKRRASPRTHGGLGLGARHCCATPRSVARVRVSVAAGPQERSSREAATAPRADPTSPARRSTRSAARSGTPRASRRTRGGRWVKGTRWALLKAPENRTAKQDLLLAEVQGANRRLYRAFLLKEELRAPNRGGDLSFTNDRQRWFAMTGTEPVDGDAPKSRPKRNTKNEIGAVYGPAVQAGSISVGSFHYHEGGGSGLPTPRQVPSLEGPFINRERDVGKLDQLFEQREIGMTPIAVITGMHGVGKTAIGRYWAHANGDRFAGGQLYADFNELRQGGGVDISGLLGSFLRSLGLGDEVIPDTLSERSALFSSKAAEKGVLLLLDNVDHVAQVRPLVPSPSGSVVLVTSYAPLEELVRDGAKPVSLRPLDRDDAAAVLVRTAGDDARLEGEPAAVEELVRICAGLPIALKICGARLALEAHRTVAWLADHLSEESVRLERMSLGSEDSIQVVFTDAYRALGERARMLYRRLGLHPGPSFTPFVAAAAADISVGEANGLLDELSRAHLVEGEDERLRFHDLLRIHARKTAEGEEPEHGREATVRRIVDFYVDASQRMDYAIIPTRLRLSEPLSSQAQAESSFRSTADALGWFEAERTNLLAVLRAASVREWDVSAWRIGEALWLPYHNRKYYGEAIEVYSLAATAARRCDNDAAEARLRSQLARAHLDLDDHAGAETELKMATELAERSGNRALQASVVEFTGVLEAARERYPEAIVAFERARAVCKELDSRRGVAIQEYHLGRVLDLAGRHRRAIESLLRAADLIDGETDGLTLGRVLLHLGEAQRAVGDRTLAVDSLNLAIEVMRTEEAPFYEALARERLARVKRELGEVGDAREHLERALTIYTALSSPRADEVKLALAETQGGST